MSTADPSLPDLEAFADLVCARLDGSISPADHAVLDRAIVASAAHRAVYRELASLDAIIAWDRRWPHAGVESKAKHGVASAAQSTSGAFRLRFIAYAVAAALLLAAGAVAIVLITLAADPAKNDRAPASIAMLVDATDTLIYERDVTSPGDEYASGTYALDAGSAQLLLINQVTIDMRGGARLTLHDAMHATVTHGSVSFRCPPGAVGYTVTLPGGTRVVDLGTAFTIDADADGAAHVSVTEGRVRIDPPAGEPVTIAAGQSIRVSDNPDRPLGAVVDGLPNPLRNGGFETPDIATGEPGVSAELDAMSPWSYDGSTGDIVRLYDGSFFGALVAHEGSQYIGFTSNGAPAGGVVSQPLATVVGTRYRVAFHAANVWFVGGQPDVSHGLIAHVDNDAADQITAVPAVHAIGVGRWEPFAFEFVATAPTTTLSFASVLIAGNSDNADILLDGVTVEMITHTDTDTDTPGNRQVRPPHLPTPGDTE